MGDSSPLFLSPTVRGNASNPQGAPACHGQERDPEPSHGLPERQGPPAPSWPRGAVCPLPGPGAPQENGRIQEIPAGAWWLPGLSWQTGRFSGCCPSGSRLRSGERRDSPSVGSGPVTLCPRTAIHAPGQLMTQFGAANRGLLSHTEQVGDGSSPRGRERNVAGQEAGRSLDSARQDRVCAGMEAPRVCSRVSLGPPNPQSLDTPPLCPRAPSPGPTLPLPQAPMVRIPLLNQANPISW